MDGQKVLVTELRSLFRHAPLSPTDLQTHAPNLTRSLNAPTPEQAMVRLWDIFDEFPGDALVGAAAASLGFTQTGNVLNRMVEYAPHKSDRQVRRDAYKGIDKVVAEIARRYDIVYAFGEVLVGRTDAGLHVNWNLTANASMRPALIELSEWQDGGDHNDVTVTVLDGEGIIFKEPYEGIDLWSIRWEWIGEVMPTWEFKSLATMQLFVDTTPTSFTIGSRWVLK